jgi:hypothetical protein
MVRIEVDIVPPPRPKRYRGHKVDDVRCEGVSKEKGREKKYSQKQLEGEVLIIWVPFMEFSSNLLVMTPIRRRDDKTLQLIRMPLLRSSSKLLYIGKVL